MGIFRGPSVGFPICHQDQELLYAWPRPASVFSQRLGGDYKSILDVGVIAVLVNFSDLCHKVIGIGESVASYLVDGLLGESCVGNVIAS